MFFTFGVLLSIVCKIADTAFQRQQTLSISHAFLTIILGDTVTCHTIHLHTILYVALVVYQPFIMKIGK